jgi:hypothetical protein
MAFVLPGNTRALRFTGETKALEPKRTPQPSEAAPADAVALGKPRARRAPGEPPPRPVAVAPEPAFPAFPPTRRVLTPVEHHHPYAGSMRAPSFHQKIEDDNDEGTVEGFYENPTVQLSRDALRDVLPGSRAPEVNPPPRNGAPIPHFRASSPGVVVHPRSAKNSTTFVVPRVAARKAQGSLPLAVWIVAALIVGGISFRFVPEAVARIEPRAVGLQR